MAKIIKLRLEISTFADNFIFPVDVDTVPAKNLIYGAFPVYRILPYADYIDAHCHGLCIKPAAIPPL
jgi:hypothetical protein